MSDKGENVYRVLVVDDDHGVCNSIQTMLGLCRFRVETANSGKQALELLGQNQYDLVITDYLMPLMRGDKVAEAAKQLSTEIPVIMITGFAEMLKPDPMFSGVDLIMAKPFSLEDLLVGIAKVFKRVGSSPDDQSVKNLNKSLSSCGLED